MIPHTTTTAAGPGGGEDYTTGEGLRALLARLHEGGPGAWRTDATTAKLMQYAADKYAALARKHGLDPWEAAAAAFDVMRTRSAREADDPWGVVTHAVRITCIAEERAQGLLCSTHQARRPHYSVFHDAERLSDRENPLDDYHPAFHITDPHPDDENRVEREMTEPAGAQTSASVWWRTRSRSSPSSAGRPRPPAPRSNMSATPSPAPAPDSPRSRYCAATSTPAPCSTYLARRGRRCCGHCSVTLPPGSPRPRRGGASCCAC